MNKIIFGDLGGYLARQVMEEHFGTMNLTEPESEAESVSPNLKLKAGLFSPLRGLGRIAQTLYRTIMPTKAVEDSQCRL